MIKFFLSFFELFSKQYFFESVSDSGIFVTLFFYIFCSLLVLLLFVFSLPFFPLALLNEWSKKWFNK